MWRVPELLRLPHRWSSVGYIRMGASSRAIAPHEYRVRWVASRCRVSLATAETVVANAGFSDGERRR